MKACNKNIILVLLLLVAGLTAKAQSTARNPYEGATHTYAWSGISVGADFEFYIASNREGTQIYNDDATGEFDFVTQPSGKVADDGLASVQISWFGGASMNTYYLWLEVTGESGCSNYRYVEVNPQVNAFDLLSENIPTDHTVSCPDISENNGFDVMGTNNGTTVLTFRVSRVNGTDNTLTADAGDTYNWSFIPKLTVDPNLGLDNVIISIEGLNSGIVTADVDNRYSINGLDDEVTVTVSIQNAPGEYRVVGFEVTEQREDRTNLNDSNEANDLVTHTIQVMPVINSMGGV